MATGVPKKRSATNDHQVSFDAATNAILQFPQKRTVGEILAIPPAKTVPHALGKVSRGVESSGRLYFGDNLPILAHLMVDSSVRGTVRLVYIDPPFATETVFHSRNLDHAYDDVLTGGDYLEFVRERLVLLRELLAPDGSIYIHLDGKMVFHVKLIMDEIFGPSNFRNCITRKKCNFKNYTRKQYGNVADFILFYTKSSEYVWNKPVEAWTEERAREYHYIDEATGRRFMKVPVHAPGIRHGATGKPWRGVPPPPGKHWQFPPSVLDEMDSRGEIYWSPNGNPRRKIFLDDSPGVSVQDIWLDFKDAHNQNVHITGYPTEKNPDLLGRIIAASSNPGDLVLDCFSGSGTTLSVADALGRRWIGVDNSIEAIKTTLRRFQHGLEPMGDFVSDRQVSNTDKKKEQESLALFDFKANVTEPEQTIIPQSQSEGWFSPKAHKRIDDFILLSEASLYDYAVSLIPSDDLCPLTPEQV